MIHFNIGTRHLDSRATSIPTPIFSWYDSKVLKIIKQNIEQVKITGFGVLCVLYPFSHWIQIEIVQKRILIKIKSNEYNWYPFNLI